MRLQNINKFTRMLAAVATLGLLTGCQKQKTASYAIAEAPAMMATAAPPTEPQRTDTLAYEHSVSIELDPKLVSARLREIEAACTSGKPVECTVLEVNLHRDGDVFNGMIRMRIAPQGVDSTIAAASQDGTVSSRLTRAEDLAQPMADTQRRLSLMTTHRDRLTELMKSKDLKIEQLITVSKELASVQTEIDALGTQQAQLRRRVDTDLLTINLSPPRAEYFSQQTPIRDALKLFGSNFREAIGQVINFIAVVVPWLVIILPGLYLLRAFWSWISRTLARRRQRKEMAA